MSVVSENEKRPAPKLLPYGVADIKFLCQWYEKTSFLINSLHWHKKYISVQENQRKSLQWHKKNMSAPGKNECWRKNVMSGPEKMKEKTQNWSHWRKKHTSGVKLNRSTWPDLFIADVKLIRQWYWKMKKIRQKIEISLVDIINCVTLKAFFRIWHALT